MGRKPKKKFAKEKICSEVPRKLFFIKELYNGNCSSSSERSWSKQVI